MTRGLVGAVCVIAVGVVVFGLPALAYANHPAGRVGVWIGLLVFALAFATVWMVLALIDRLRRTPRTRERREGTQQ